MIDQKRMQAMLTDMLKWFHAFCEEHGLRYYAIAGTMLGAARHEGFIPWDDDIDVGMPREDYNKLAELLRGKTDGRYVLETPESEAREFTVPFSKLFDTHTTIIESNKYKTKRGIFIDIFPLDGTGATREESERNVADVFKTYNVLLSKISGIRKGRKLYKNLAVVAFKFIPVSEKKLLRSIVSKCSRYSFDECDWVGCLVGDYRLKEIMPREYFGEPKLYKFEDTVIYGVADAESYLTSVYGDWRKLPPPEKQVSHHDYMYASLDEAYR